MKYDEDSRVKIPAILHMIRLGYQYQSKKNIKIDERNNIFKDIFKENIRRINNKDYDDEFLENLIKEIENLTENEKDKGEHFFNRLVSYNEPKLIDLKDYKNNDFRVVTELSFKSDKEVFRPDITVLINGIPLGFIEVKKPNNKDGIQAEFQRMFERMRIPQFRKFFNQFQVVGFTNNMEYNDDERIKLQGSYYATPNFEGTKFNHFREEKAIAVNEYLSPDLIDEILHDNNAMSIKNTPEFYTNLEIDTPGNSFITSVFEIERLIFFIRYGVVYVNSVRDGLQKHIMRYPQYFAIKAALHKIKMGLKRGIIWHTQGSGKTALGYFLTAVLRDYFQEKNIITKFYFVVDRIDLLIQATDEFSSRGLTIAAIDSKNDFVKNMKSPVIVPSNATDGLYKETINVVNIQKFSENSTVDITLQHDIQRIYFLDEVHRSYKPKGTFLANLLGADPNGIFIGLTGTPLLKSDFKSTDIFSGYIHKYYYNKSIADGYTLKIKKENISVTFKEQVRNSLDLKPGEKIMAKKWEEETKKMPFIEKIGGYIEEDFEAFKTNDNIHDDTLGFMAVASSTEQAKRMKEWFDTNSKLKVALVLSDEDGNKEKQEGFRGKRNKDTGKVESEYDGVIVFNMLLTGFDSPRLKRLYLMREITEHSLLQTLARVNRPYKAMKYGYVVDFVDITEQYEETNRRYLEELRADIADDDDTTDVEEIFIDVEVVKRRVIELEGTLFKFMGNIEKNLEQFSKQIQYLDEDDLRNLKEKLEEYKECYNELRMSHEDTSNIPIERLNKALIEVTNKIKLLVAERFIEDPSVDVSDIDIVELVFEFIKTGESELEFATGDDFLDKVARLKNLFSANNDKEDPSYADLNQEFKGIIKRFKNEADTADKAKIIASELDQIYVKIGILNMDNTSLTNSYSGDDSYMRIHKRLKERYPEDLDDVKIRNIMLKVIEVIDNEIKSLGIPTEAVIKLRLRKPIRKAFIEEGFEEVSVRMADTIAMLFIDDKFKK